MKEDEISLMYCYPGPAQTLEGLFTYYDHDTKESQLESSRSQFTVHDDNDTDCPSQTENVHVLLRLSDLLPSPAARYFTVCSSPTSSQMLPLRLSKPTCN